MVILNTAPRGDCKVGDVNMESSIFNNITETSKYTYICASGTNFVDFRTPFFVKLALLCPTSLDAVFVSRNF